MKIDRKKNVIRLNPSETKLWESGAPKGFDFRRAVRDIAYGMLRTTSKQGERGAVEVYASERAGGWMADHLTHHDLPETP